MRTLIWSDQQLEQWKQDAIGQIAIDVRCIWQRECLATTRGVSVIRLPNYVRSLARATWRGVSLIPQNWEELTVLTPATVFLHHPPDSAGNIESIGRPQFYAQHPTDPYDIRLFPCPDESFAIIGEPNPYAPQANSPSFIIDYWREPSLTSSDPIISLPPYIERRIQKAYVLWKAFAAEGKGQDMQASGYYQSRYQFLINNFRSINEGTFVAKKYMLGDPLLDPEWGRPPRPSLPSRYERIIF
jgi:hypothetical protein